MRELSDKTITSRPSRPVKVLQFGGGNFLRAFVDWMIQVLNEETDFNGNIAVVKPSPRGDYNALKEQDGLYHVILNGIKSGTLHTEHKLIESISQVVHPYNEWVEYLALAELDELRFIVSNTTESGIRYNENEVYSKDTCPIEFPAKLCRWLWHRFNHFNGDESKTCIILPLELIEGNGDELHRCIDLYIDAWKLGVDFKSWVKTCVFCNTLVDRIVSGYPEQDATQLESDLGYRDELLVAGEYYHSWVIQAPVDISSELPVAKTDLNVKFEDDLDIHRKIKVRILNGAHTSMVPVGLLSNIETVIASMGNDQLRAFIQEELVEEILPTIDYNKNHLNDYCQDVLDRFSNPTLQHKLADISLNSTSKFVTRLLPSMLDYNAINNKLPRRIVFAFAALIKLYQGDWQGKKRVLRDAEERINFFAEVWADHGNDLSVLVPKVLGNQEVWGQDLNSISGLSVLLQEYLSNMNHEIKILTT